MRAGTTSQTPIRGVPWALYDPLLASLRGSHVDVPRLFSGQASPLPHVRPYAPAPQARSPVTRRRLGTAASTGQASAADAWWQRRRLEGTGDDRVMSFPASITQGRLRSPHASGPQYEESVPIDVQYQIMRLLAEAAPEDALRLAATGRTQRSLLQTIPARALGLPAGFSTIRADSAREGTGIDYARSLVALGAGGGQQAVALAQALCLMQAFARLLLHNKRYELSIVRGDRRDYLMTLQQAGDVAPDASILDAFGVINPTDGHPIDPALVRDWYLWIMSQDDKDFTAAARASLLWTRLQRALGGGGRGDYPPMLIPNVLAERLASGDVLGVGPARPLALPLTVVEDLPGDKLLDIFDAHAGALMGVHLTVDDIERQKRLDNPGSPFAAALASPQAERAFKAYLDNQVAAHHRGACRDFETATGLSLPPFTSLFDVDLYVMRRRDWLWGIVASMRSPRIESLLASAGVWPPPPRA
ncbi:hypothetical protein pqer_cds_519 [Pandoravirus quercus]|uniref:Uncharacterized protein n=1 Tax=Pandoravirus quercus TaxID=2107709 RepID=A0A2U7U919_9VIRU|nr:hypothetical protein pqer_cds_519 [Pandoravirus quercus]AVK74941.1 hypothetical protein pqer_cds_519 [Pandoravirus quercus]